MIWKQINRMWSVLSSAERKKANLLLLMLIIGTGLEMLSIGAVLPFAAYLFDPSSSGKGWLAMFPPEMSTPEVDLKIAAVLAAALSLLFILKTVYLSALAFFQCGFSYSVQRRIASELFYFYITRPYDYHLNRHSSEMIRNIVTESSQISSAVLTPAVMLLSELLVLAGMFCLVLLVNPSGTLLIAILLGIMAIAILFLSRKSLSKWGARRQFHEGRRLQEIQHALGGVMEVILFDARKVVRQRFDHHNAESMDALKAFATVQLLPRQWIELAGVFCLVFLLMLALSQGQSGPEAMATFSLYAAVAFRTMPSFNRIVSCAQSLRFGAPSIQHIAEELEPLRSNQDNEPGDVKHMAKGLIRGKDIVFSYPGGSDVLNGVNFTIIPGEAVGILGESGAGKSTLLGILLGLLRPTDGVLTCGEVPIVDKPEAWHRSLGYVPQSVYLNDDSLLRNVAFGISDEQIDSDRVRSVLSLVRLDAWLQGLPDGLATNMGESGARVSGGQRQRIGIARALYRQPEVLILDEPTSALDPTTEREVMDVIASLKGRVTIIVVTHNKSTLIMCDKIWTLSGGKLNYVD